MIKPKELLQDLMTKIPKLHNRWDAKECILEMRANGYRNWKQIEWIGFYMEYLTENTKLEGVSQFRLVIGNVQFNGSAGKNVIDYKTSTTNGDVILNDKSAIDEVINKYKELVYIILQGNAEFEHYNEFAKWREASFGESSYSKQRKEDGRPHRPLKTSFIPKRILYISISMDNVRQLKIFKQGRNSDGSPRNVKYMLPANKIALFLKETLDLLNMHL